MHGERDRLGPTEILILRPNILDLNGLDPRGQSRGLRRIEKILDALAKATKSSAPVNFQALVHKPLEAAGAEKKNFRLSFIPVPKEFFVKGTSPRSIILTGRSNKNCLRLDQKLSGNKDCRRAEIRQRRTRHGNDFFRPCALGLAQFVGKEVDKSWHLCPSGPFRRGNGRLNVRTCRYDSRRLGKVARPSTADTASPCIVTYVVTLLSEVSRRTTEACDLCPVPQGVAA